MNWKMYETVTANFRNAMIKELAANHTKGDRELPGGWLGMSNKQQLSELYYHVGKLQAAMATGDVELIKEHSADIANAALMVYDRFSPLMQEQSTSAINGENGITKEEAREKYVQAEYNRYNNSESDWNQLNIRGAWDDGAKWQKEQDELIISDLVGKVWNAHQSLVQEKELRKASEVALNASINDSLSYDDKIKVFDRYIKTIANYKNPIISYQEKVKEWAIACFGENVVNNKTERSHRFLEEALELVQACGCSKEEALQLVDYVFNREVGEIKQEVGGVMTTLATLCYCFGLDMHQAGDDELYRVYGKIDQIRAKNASKPRNSPLPGVYPESKI